MKKRLAITLAALLLFAACVSFSGCTKTYTVTLISDYNKDFTKHKGNNLLFENVYDGVWDKIEVKENGVIGNIEVDVKLAEKKGYKFCGWFTDESYTLQWNTLTDPVKTNITLYAKWEEIK